MAVTAGMDFSTLARAPGAAVQIGGADEAPSPVAGSAQAGVQGDSFDSLMNLLLAAPRVQGTAMPADAVMDASGDVPVDASLVEGGVPEDPEGPLVTLDIGAEMAGKVCAGPVSRGASPAVLPVSTETLLPPDGKALPSEVAGAPAVDPAQLPAGIGQEDAAGDVPPCADDVTALLPEAPAVAADRERSQAAEEGIPAAISDGQIPAPVLVHSVTVAGDDGNHAGLAPESARMPGAAPATMPAVNPAATAAPADGTSSASNNGVVQAGTAPVTAAPAPATPEALGGATAARTDVSARVEMAAIPSAAAPGPQPDAPPDGGARLQELLARFGAADGAPAARSDGMQALLRDPDGTAPTNSGALTYAQTSASAPAREAPVPGPALHTPLRHPEWNEELGQRIRWAIGNQIQTAELKINPPQLGPIEVRVSMDADRQMSVTLSSQHALVRETLQDSLPRLRDLMSEQGFGAVNVDVSQHSPSDGGRTPARQGGTESAPRMGSAPVDAADPGAARPREVRGLVDLYA